MLRSNRGAARVSAVWMISVGVVALAAVAFGFISQSDLKKFEEQAALARADLAKETQRADEAAEKRRNVSTMLGFYDTESADPESDLSLAQQELEDLRTTFADIAETDDSFQAVIPKIVDAYNKAKDEAATHKARISALEGEVASSRAAVTQIQNAKDQTIQDLQQQLANEQQNAATRQQDLEDRIAGLTQQVSDRDAQLRTALADSADAQRAWDKEKRLYEGRIVNANEQLRPFQGEHATEADGRILEASAKTRTAWIDLGSNHLLARGMRFRVEGGIAGQRELKAWAEVTDVEPNRARVAISGQVDPYNDVMKGDVIVNPVYDPKSTRIAVLAGSFSEYTRGELEALLSGIGITIQDEVDTSTDFLIVGGPLYNDPLTNEPLEEPLAVTELAEYQNAANLSVLVLPLKDLRQFFSFGA